MNHYKIKIAGPKGRSTVMELEKPDDLAALNSALELCGKHTFEIWEGQRQIGAFTLSGTPRLTL